MCSYSGARTADGFLQFLEEKIEQDRGFARIESLDKLASAFLTASDKAGASAALKAAAEKLDDVQRGAGELYAKIAEKASSKVIPLKRGAVSIEYRNLSMAGRNALCSEKLAAAAFCRYIRSPLRQGQLCFSNSDHCVHSPCSPVEGSCLAQFCSPQNNGPTDRPPCLSGHAWWMHAGVRLGSDRVSKAGAIAGLAHVDTDKASETSKKVSVLTGYVPDSRAITERGI